MSKRLAELVVGDAYGSNGTRIVYNQAVVKVTQESGLVSVLTQTTHERDEMTPVRRVYKARYCVSSMPLNQYAGVAFEPELPIYKRNFLKFIQVGNYIKFIVT